MEQNLNSLKPKSVSAELWSQIPSGKQMEFLSAMAIALRNGIHPEEFLKNELSKINTKDIKNKFFRKDNIKKETEKQLSSPLSLAIKKTLNTKDLNYVLQLETEILSRIIQNPFIFEDNVKGLKDFIIIDDKILKNCEDILLNIINKLIEDIREKKKNGDIEARNIPDPDDWCFHLEDSYDKMKI